mmetsp:Transcript_31167/g.87631  ORF Transcript_31167/g.87631 Transcript_31167/m.87631 type:complete len:96 (+) Transcript_31167:1-288(+)
MADRIRPKSTPDTDSDATEEGDAWEPRLVEPSMPSEEVFAKEAERKAEQARKLRATVERRRLLGDSEEILGHYEQMAQKLESEVESFKLQTRSPI